jgi:hypothetical protein
MARTSDRLMPEPVASGGHTGKRVQLKVQGIENTHGDCRPSKPVFLALVVKLEHGIKRLGGIRTSACLSVVVS